MTGTFVDYALPTAAELPSFETDRTETPSPVNSLGVKGVGEAGTIAATPAVAQRRDRRAAAARRHVHRHAAARRCGSWAGDPSREGKGRCVSMIPAEFDYAAPESLDEAHPAARRRRRGRQAARRRALADPADEAAAGGADAARRPAQGARPAAASSARTARWRIGAMTPPRDLQHAPDLGLASAVAAARSPTRRSATAARSAARSPTATRPPTCRRCCSPPRAR